MADLTLMENKTTVMDSLGIGEANAVDLINRYNDLSITPQSLFIKNGISLSCEGFKEQLYDFIDYILKLLKNIAIDIINGSTIVNATIFKLRIRLDDLYDLTRSTSSNMRDPKFTVTTRIRNLSFRYRPITEVNGLSQAVNNLNNVSEAYLNYLNKSLQQLNSISISPESLIQVMGEINPIFVLSKEPTFKKNNNNNSLSSLHLLGNRVLTVVNESDVSNNSKIRLIDSEREPLEIPNELEFERFSRTNQLSLLRRLEKTLNILERTTGTNVTHRRRNKISELTNFLTKVKDSEVVTDEEEMKELIKNIQIITDWLTEPHSGFTGLLCRNVSAVMNVCELNIK